MNKQDLSNQTKIPGNGIDSILDAMDIPKDLPDYTDEHLKLVQAIKDIHKNEGLKSWTEAVGIYRKPEREAQLQEIAVRYAIAHERIPEVLGAMKLKLETLTEPQVQLFQDVCQMLQSGMDLAMASQAIADKAKEQAKTKAAAKKFPEFAQDATDAENPPEQSTAIALAKDNPMPELVVKEVESVPPDAREQIDAVARAVGPSAVPDLVEVITDEATAIDQGIRQYSRQALLKAISENSRPQGTPEEAVELFKKKQAERLAQRYGQ